MDGEVIKSFLVGLGFGVDDSSLSKFNKALTTATLKVTALATATIAMATAVAKSITSVSDDFEQMGYEYHLIAPAINKALLLRQEMLKAYSAAGVNIYKVIQSSIKLNFSLDKTKFAFKALYSGVAAKFFPLLQKQSDIFRNSLYKNMPKIQHGLEEFVKVVFKSLEMVIQLGGRVWEILIRLYDFFDRLDKATGGWSTKIIAAIAAWRLLNLSFLATPIGMIFALIAALIVLYDDFKVWQAHGSSVINWGSETTKAILGIVTAVVALGAAIGAVILAMKLWTAVQVAFWAVAALNPLGIIIASAVVLIGLLTTLAAKFGYLKGIGSFFGDIGGKVLDYIGGSNAPANIQNNPIGRPMSSPIGGNVQNSTSSNVINQKVDMHVNSSAPADHVASQTAALLTNQTRDTVGLLGKNKQ